MRILFLIGLVFLSVVAQARQMYKVKCLTPAGRDDRTKLARYIHLDMISDDSVVAVVNQDELKDLQTKVNLEIEILSAFETDNINMAKDNFNVQLLMQEQVEQGLNFSQEIYISSKSIFEIDLNDIVKEKIPNDKREYSFSLVKGPNLTTDKNNRWKILGNSKLKGQKDQILFETSTAVNPVIRITIIINYI